ASAGSARGWKPATYGRETPLPSPSPDRRPVAPCRHRQDPRQRRKRRGRRGGAARGHFIRERRDGRSDQTGSFLGPRKSPRSRRLGMQKAQVQLGVAQGEGDAVFFADTPEGGAMVSGGLAILEALQGLVEASGTLVGWQDVSPVRPVGSPRNPDAGRQAIADVMPDLSANDQADEPRHFHGVAVPAEVDPRREGAESLAGGPVAAASELAGLVGGDDAVNLGKQLADGVVANLAAIGGLGSVDLGGHNSLNSEIVRRSDHSRIWRLSQGM